MMVGRLLVLVFLIGWVASGVEGQSRERDQVIRLLGNTYLRITDARNILFEIDRFHVIRAEFDKRKRLIELAVEPKYYFEDDHPDWATTRRFCKSLASGIYRVINQAKTYKGSWDNGAIGK